MHSDTQPTLTEREIDVLSLLQKGKQNKVIAYALNISESTTKVHIRNIMRKYRLRNRTEVALLCDTEVRQRLGDILVRPRNAGLIHTGDPRGEFEIIGPAKWPAIVDEDTWRAVHALLTAPSRRVTRKSYAFRAGPS